MEKIRNTASNSGLPYKLANQGAIIQNRSQQNSPNTKLSAIDELTTTNLSASLLDDFAPKWSAPLSTPMGAIIPINLNIFQPMEKYPNSATDKTFANMNCPMKNNPLPDIFPTKLTQLPNANVCTN